jgi:transcriptional regulator with XRE-family HTH domain
VEKSFAIGAFFKKYREQRRISLRAASPDSPSTLSRFENGQSRISGERLRAVMQREGIRYWDMQQHSDQYLSPFKQVADLLYLERFNMQSERVDAAVRQYKTRTVSATGRLQELNMAVLDAVMKARKTGVTTALDIEIQQDIQRVLFASRDWIIYDYCLLRLAANYMPTDVLKRCFKRAIVQQDISGSEYGDYYLRLVEQVSLVLLCRRDAEVQTLCAPQLSDELVNRFDGEDGFTIHFLNIMFNGDTRAEVETRLSEMSGMLKTLGLVEMDNYFRSYIELIYG